MKLDFETMPIDDLWQLHKQIGHLLAEKLTSEKRKLEQRLSQLGGDLAHTSTKVRQRRYPKARPKYQNPDDLSQTWAGRGTTPRWINEMLTAGKSIEELRINERAARDQAHVLADQVVAGLGPIPSSPRPAAPDDDRQEHGEFVTLSSG